MLGLGNGKSVEEWAIVHVLEATVAMDYGILGLAAIETGRDFAVLLLTFVATARGLALAG